MGTGMFATQDIPLGRLILNERVLLITPAAYAYSPALPLVHPDRIFETLIGRFDDESRKEFYRLHNCKGTSMSETRGIKDTNMLSIGTLPGSYKGEHGAPGLAVSRINHSCSPNAIWTFDLKTLSMRILATQPIKKGEQIFVPYTSTFAPRRDRQHELLTNYSFTCTCPTCQLPENESLQSDTRRAFLLAAENRFDKDVLTPQSSEPSAASERDRSELIVKALDEEKLTGSHPVFALWHLARLGFDACEVEDRKGAVKWGRRFLEIAESGLEEGARHAVKDWRNIVEKPESMMNWGLRKRL